MTNKKDNVTRYLMLLGYGEPMFSFYRNQSVTLHIVIRNEKIVWKVVWIEYYLRLNLSF